MDDQKTDTQSGDIARRDFVALSVAAGLTASAEAAADLVETDVEIKTPDGTCDAAFIHPKTGSHPGVLIWPDAFGLRPSMRDIGKRIAAEGYSVLVPNPFYRVAKAPFTDASNFSFQNPADMAKLRPLMASVNAPGNAEKDAVAYVAFLDAQKRSEQGEEDRNPGLLHGRTARCEDRRGAAQSHWRGGVVPRRRPGHRQARQPASARAEDQGARMYFGIASNDDARQPDAKDKLKEAFAAAKVPPRSKSIRKRCTAGACRTCPSRTASRFTTSPTPSAPGPSWWPCIRLRCDNINPTFSSGGKSERYKILH